MLALYRSACSVAGSRERFRDVTEPQRLGWPEIQAGRDVLISAPTGSGKTLAAFLTAIDSLGPPGPRRRAAEPDTDPLCFAAQGAEQRHSQESGCSAGRDRETGCVAGSRARADSHRRAHRRHAGCGAPADGQESAAHPGDDARVALHSADRRRAAEDAVVGAHADRRRDSRRGRR